MSDYNFSFGDKLPWLSDAAIAIFSKVAKPQSVKMKEALTAYRKGLVLLWQKCFSQENIVSRRTIEKKLANLVKDFYNQVYTKVKRKSSKKGDALSQRVSMRVAILEWRKKMINY